MRLNLTSNVDRQPSLYNEAEEDKATAAARYQQLISNRNPFLQRARDCSKVTIPGLIPDDIKGDHGGFKTPYQSLGARGVNYLASKLLITLFPPNSAFFKLEIDDLALRVEESGPEIKAEFDSALVNVERAVMSALDTANGRASMHEAFKHLLVGGNVLLYVAEDGIKVIHMSRYALCRDPMGHVTEIVVEEEVYPEILPKGFLDDAEQEEEEGGYAKNKTVKLYTRVEFEEGKCHWWQEAKGKEIPKTHGMCDADVSPWIPLRWGRIDGEEYGRGYVEEYYGDLTALESLYQAVLEGSAAAARILFLVNPNGTTRPRTLANARNGAIVQGNAADVTVIQSQKAQDLGIAQNTIDRIEGRLQFAFLLNTAIQRPGERVTAEEIRFMSQELEAGIGGLYSILTQELQLPLVRRLMHVLRRQRKLSPFPKSATTGAPLVNPKPVTGLEAIGRGDDRNKLVEFITTVAQALGPEVMTKFINMDEALRRLANSESIDTTNLVKTKEQMDAEDAAAQQQQQDAVRQQMMADGMKSPALANLVDNYTQPGAPYGPQYANGIDQPQVPNQLPSISAQQQPPSLPPGA